MSDDLLKRLDEAANDTHYIDHITAREAAARIRDLQSQLAEARADGWRKGIEAAAAVNNFQAQEILDSAAPASAVNALRWAEKCIRALPLPADLAPPA